MRDGLDALAVADASLARVTAKAPAQLAQAMGARSMLLTSRAILTAGLLREESRSEHYREDLPSRGDTFANRAIELSLSGDADLEIEPRLIDL
jgi:succinate dehydrogenase/fumarate reductase flavoprotein subunit